MTSAVDMAGRNRRGWLSVLGSCLAIFFTGTMSFGYPGVTGTYLNERYGSGSSLVLTFLLIALGMGMFCVGKLHNRIGTRRCFLLGIVCAAGGFVVLNIGHSVLSCYIFGFLIGWSASFVYSPGLTNVQNWFPNRRGLVSGIVNLIFGISAAVMSPLMNTMLNGFGFEKMNWILLGMLAVVTFIGACLAEMPDRAGMTEEQKAAHQQLLEELASGGSKGPGTALTVGQAMRTPAFWMLWFTWLFMGTAGISMVSLSKSYTVALGMTGVVALTCFNLTNGISRIIAGSLSDILGRRPLGCVAFLVAAVGYAGLPFVHSLLSFCILAACVGFGFGTLFAISAPLATDLFGLKYFGMIFGLVFTAYGFCGGIFGPMVSSAILKANGNNFTPVFAYLAVFCVLAAILILLTKHRDN